MTAASTTRDVASAAPVVVGLIEAVGQLGDNELFVSGWSRERPAPGTRILATGQRQTIEGRIWTAWSDRTDVGLRTAYTGVIELARPIDAADLATIQLGSARRLALYEHRTLLDRAQAIGLMRAALPAAMIEGQRQRLEQVAARFDGTDTIASATQPVRVGIDDCVALPGDTVLISGWMFDPESLVAAAWVSTDATRSRVDLDWVTQARPDVGASFAADPRFGLYRPLHAAHGFVALAGGVAGTDRLHLTVTTRDGSAFHVPLVARRGEPLPLLRGFLALLDPDLPTSLDVVDRLVAPILSAIDAPRPRLLHHTVGLEHSDAPLTLVIGCCGDGADLPMLLAMLAADPATRDLPMIVAADRRELAGLAGQIARAAEAYGLVVAVAHGDGIGDHLDALAVGSMAASSPRLCLMAADRLPRGTGWLTALLAAHCSDQVTLSTLFDGNAAGSQSSQRERARLASDLGCCIIERTAFVETVGQAANRLDQATKSEALLDYLSSSGLQIRVVEAVEVLSTSQPQPSARLARRADVRATERQLPLPQAAE